MAIGTQEILAIVFVIAIVGFALYRRLHRKSSAAGACSGCEHGKSDSADEKPVHFYKKRS